MGAVTAKANISSAGDNGVDFSNVTEIAAFAEAGAGNDIIADGAGVDNVATGAGADTIVVRGTIAATDYDAADLTGTAAAQVDGIYSATYTDAIVNGLSTSDATDSTMVVMVWILWKSGVPRTSPVQL